jgi:predicted RNA-binding Zn ribbon-like protein
LPHEMPAYLRPVLDFINTVDVEDGTDIFDGPPSQLSRWLAAQRLAPRDASAGAADLRLALDLRAGLRSLALINNQGVPDEPALQKLKAALSRLPLAATVTGTLEPHASSPVRAALARIVAGYAQAVAAGTWSRLRRCPAEDCAWAFWDSSPKGTRRWDVMRVCGNRAKARTFAAKSRIAEES